MDQYKFLKKKVNSNTLFLIIWEAFDFVLNTYSMVLVKGIQQAIANHLASSAKIFLKWTMNHTNNLLDSSQKGIFFVVVTSLLLRFGKNRKNLTQNSTSNQLIPSNQIMFQNNGQSFIWVPVPVNQFMNQNYSNSSLPLLKEN